MAKAKRSAAGPKSVELAKIPTGIAGLDEITQGGFPRGRTTLVVGGPGTGKSLLGIQFLAAGAARYGEPGVLMTFEETGREIADNVRSLGIDVAALTARKLLSVDYVKVDRNEIEETGAYDLEGLFIRLGQAIDSIGAKRVVLDTIESLFGGLSNLAILRAELRRLFRWLKDRGMSTLVTAETGTGGLTREGLEEYVSDCVLVLDHRVEDQVSTRRMRLVKYRGSHHGTNEYPFFISERGFQVLPITSVGLESIKAGRERISTGIARLDAMLGGKGYFRGSSILVSGTAGTGKSSVGATFAAAACARGERCLYFCFEELAGQLVRNMRSIGIDLDGQIRKGRLKVVSSRPTLFGLEEHLVAVQRLVEEFDPAVVVMDPISNMISVGSEANAKSMLTRLMSYLKFRGVTALFTSLTEGGAFTELTTVGVSSLADTWLLLRDIELGGERNRAVYVLKSRGMAHSNQIREFVLTDRGIDLLDVYTGPGGVLTGTARLVREAEERDQVGLRRKEIARLEADLAKRRHILEARNAQLRAEHEADVKAIEARLAAERLLLRNSAARRENMARSRKADKS